tara:strand:- start:448 stop:1098 length:651 start_codon:yes stop_codon:yes gene_type:complete
MIKEKLQVIKEGYSPKIYLNRSGYSLVELVITVGIISTLSGLALPSFLNWVRTERVNSYTREVNAYLRIVRLEARRWGTSCFINIKPISFNSLNRGQDTDGYSVSCEYSIQQKNSSNSESMIGSLVPKINNSVFQVINKNFQVTPNGRISSDKSIVVVIGSRYNKRGPKILNCLVIKSPTGHIKQGHFSLDNWITNKMPTSQIYTGNELVPSNCKS